MALKSLLIEVGPYNRRTSIPRELLTGTGLDPKPRLRVDPSDTAFFEGRSFQMFHEFNIASGTSQWLRFTVPVDTILKNRDLTVLQGNIRLAVVTGTGSGTWTSKTPQITPLNNMSDVPVYARQVQADVGGSVTGVVELDLMAIETGTTQAVTVELGAPEVGRAIGTYYIEIRNTGTGVARGLIKFIWEERQPVSAVLLQT